jgi:hypothetical protein
MRMQADKSHQTADWRCRPIPQAMLQYAQTDTHYLLYLADTLRAKLIDAGESIPAALAVPLPQPGPQVSHALLCNRATACRSSGCRNCLYSGLSESGQRARVCQAGGCFSDLAWAPVCVHCTLLTRGSVVGSCCCSDNCRMIVSHYSSAML